MKFTAWLISGGSGAIIGVILLLNTFDALPTSQGRTGRLEVEVSGISQQVEFHGKKWSCQDCRDLCNLEEEECWKRCRRKGYCEYEEEGD